MNTPKTAIRQFIAGYLLHDRAEGRSPRTVGFHQQKLSVFADYLEGEHGILDPADISPDHVRAFLVFLQGVHVGQLNPYMSEQPQVLSAYTVAGYYEVIKAWSRWLVVEGHLDHAPTERITKPKTPDLVLPALTDAQIRKLLDTPEKNTPQGARDRAILSIFLDCGLRLGELVGLAVEDVHIEENFMLVRRAKGNKQRSVFFGRKTAQAIWYYLTKYRPDPAPSVANLFLDKEGQPIKGRAVADAVKRRGKQAGIPGLHPHVLRHSFATSWLRAGGDLLSLQRQMGHSDLSVTRLYLDWLDDDVAAEHKRHGVVDRLG